MHGKTYKTTFSLSSTNTANNISVINGNVHDIDSYGAANN